MASVKLYRKVQYRGCSSWDLLARASALVCVPRVYEGRYMCMCVSVHVEARRHVG